MVLSGQSYRTKDFLLASFCSRRTLFHYLKSIRKHVKRREPDWILFCDWKAKKRKLRSVVHVKGIVG